MPNQGTRDYDVQNYNITIRFHVTKAGVSFENPIEGSFAAKTIITAVANKPLNEVSLDFRPQADAVTITADGVASDANIANEKAAWTQPYFGSRIGQLNYSKLIVPVTSTIPAGTEFVVTVEYDTVIMNTLDFGGSESDDNPEGFARSADGRGVVAFGEPMYASQWFPCNNSPHDRATYNFTLLAPHTFTSVSVGERLSNARVAIAGEGEVLRPDEIGTASVSASGAYRRTTWEVAEGATPVQVFAYFSDNVIELSAPYAITSLDNATDESYNYTGSPVFYNTQKIRISDNPDGTQRHIQLLAFANKDIYNKNLPALASSGYPAGTGDRDVISYLYGMMPWYIQQYEKLFGPYPSSSAGFLIDNFTDGTNIPTDNNPLALMQNTAIETRSRQIYTFSRIMEGTGSVPLEEIFVHEMMHEYFGNQIGFDGMKELWIKEGITTYMSDYFVQQTAGYWVGQGATIQNNLDPQAKWKAVWNDSIPNSYLWKEPINDITNEDNLYTMSRAPYYRGAIVMANLREILGDKLFADFIKEYVAEFMDETVTTEALVEFIEEFSPFDMTNWANTWIYGTTKPATWSVAGGDFGYNTEYFNVLPGDTTSSLIVDTDEFVSKISANGSDLAYGSDYTVVYGAGGAIVTLTESYLTSLSGKINLITVTLTDNSTMPLFIYMDDSAGVVYNITQHFGFVTGTGSKVAKISGTELTALKVGDNTLVEGTDYTVSVAGGITTITLSADYVASLDNFATTFIIAQFGSDEILLTISKGIPEECDLVHCDDPDAHNHVCEECGLVHCDDPEAHNHVCEECGLVHCDDPDAHDHECEECGLVHCDDPDAHDHTCPTVADCTKVHCDDPDAHKGLGTGGAIAIGAGATAVVAGGAGAIFYFMRKRKA